MQLDIIQNCYFTFYNIIFIVGFNIFYFVMVIKHYSKWIDWLCQVVWYSTCSLSGKVRYCFKNEKG
jgi:hypothetical protein